MPIDIHAIKTLADLRASGYQVKPVKDELRDNLLEKLKNKEVIFPDIYGYEHTVLPDLKRAILARHNINLLGLRGQAKTKIARLLLNLLDEYTPIIKGSECLDNPFEPVSYFGRNTLAEHGEDTPIAWVHRNDRYTEKLATPDVTVADLIGDVDPIKAANLKLNYADERVIHFGLLPRANRGIFVINEIPDLQARIQVALFNILQEGDIQIRGFKFRIPLDVFFVFTANPEDYTNRGSIITPLKDRIQAQILTHYPKSWEIGSSITGNQVKLTKEQREKVVVSPLIKRLIEEIAIEARTSEYVDVKSGVSARLTISTYEQVVAAAELRAILNNEKQVSATVEDVFNALPGIVGKIEMVYEGEQEGAAKVATLLITAALKNMSKVLFPGIHRMKSNNKSTEQLNQIVDWFRNGNQLDLLVEDTTKERVKKLNAVDGLQKTVAGNPNPEVKENSLVGMEFLLYALASWSQLSQFKLEYGTKFEDTFSAVFPSGNDSLN
ncbi:MAG: sigma 54-interacting transcriptional regulator [Luteibaculaceae bacterium]